MSRRRSEANRRLQVRPGDGCAVNRAGPPQPCRCLLTRSRDDRLEGGRRPLGRVGVRAGCGRRGAGLDAEHEDGADGRRDDPGRARQQ